MCPPSVPTRLSDPLCVCLFVCLSVSSSLRPLSFSFQAWEFFSRPERGAFQVPSPLTHRLKEWGKNKTGVTAWICSMLNEWRLGVGLRARSPCPRRCRPAACRVSASPSPCSRRGWRLPPAPRPTPRPRWQRGRSGGGWFPPAPHPVSEPDI